MGVFEYIGVLISVIMGLGIVHLSTGATKLMQNRDEARFYWPHALWTLNVLIFILIIWWGMFWWSEHTSWTISEYLFITTYAIVLFILSSILYPWDMDRDIDVREYFFKNRTWFFGALMLAWCLDVPETLAKASAELRPVPQEYIVFVTLHMLIALAGLVTRNRIVHATLPVVWFALVMYYVMASLVATIET